MKNNLTDFKKIKGFLSHEEGLFLYKLAKRNCLKSFSVEIGSYCGKSACYIAEACKENKTYLISIDHHQGSEEQQFGEEYFDSEVYDYKKKVVSTLPLFLKNIKKFSLSDYIKPLVMSSEEASKIVDSEIELVFIDGSHTYESARLDFNSWKNKIKVGGILAIHDIYDTEKEGGQAPREIYETALKEKFILVDRVKSLVALRKIS